MTGNGNMNVKSRQKSHRFPMVAVVAMVMVMGAGTLAHAADDDDDDGLVDTKIVRGILKGLGFKRDEKQIEYRERSPLVLPPGKEATQLPAPQTNDVKKTANWPDDPDVKVVRQRKQAERDRKPFVEGVDDRPLLPSQYSNPNNIKPDNASGRSIEETSRPSTQAELGAKGIFSKIWGPKDEFATFTAEPPRTSLVDPPVGYRTPSPNQPYGVGMPKGDYKQVDRQVPVR